MVLWQGLNALIDWMNAHGSNDYASVTFIMFAGAVIWDKASTKYDEWKKRHQNSENAH